MRYSLIAFESPLVVIYAIGGLHHKIKQLVWRQSPQDAKPDTFGRSILISIKKYNNIILSEKRLVPFFPCEYIASHDHAMRLSHRVMRCDISAIQRCDDQLYLGRLCVFWDAIKLLK